MASLDIAVIALYLTATLAYGFWISRSQVTTKDYFLGARDLPAWAVLLSIVGTETSAITVISTPALGARGDLTFLQLPIGYLIGRIAVSAWLLPGYFRGDQQTAYARLESRFGGPTRRAISTIFLVTRFLGDSVRLFAGAIPLALMAGMSIPAAILTLGVVTLVYAFFGGLRAVVWADVVQLLVYILGAAAALVIAINMAGGFDSAWSAADAAGKLRVFDFQFSLTSPYTFLGGLLGGAMLSAASHGTDHLIVQRLLATRSLRDARIALVGSGVMVIAQFALALLVGTAIWAANLAPADQPPDEIFGQFVLDYLPAGLAGLVVAGILSAVLSGVASSINALASSFTHDLYASRTGERDEHKLLRIGKLVSAVWGLLLVTGALGFHWFTTGSGTPAVVLALSIASVTYGALLGAYLLAGTGPRIEGRDVVRGAMATVLVMVTTLFAARLAEAGLTFLTPLGNLAWPWYVPMGTAITVMVAWLSSRTRPATT
ncbi:MAG TPA: sodium:solute symporter [Gemmatimonadales bacterium]|nr:sodium:solute symporter [Gemmatimonadales bacterium]